jgi:large subunit ribosomal protein L17
MHRHGYKGRKFGRERDQRRALKRGLMLSLVREGAITTTLPKAKDIRPDFEKLVTKARKSGLMNRRMVIAKLGNIEVGNLLVDRVAPQIKRDSGYVRIVKLNEYRVGDNAEMARIEFVDEIKFDNEPVIARNEETKQSSKPKKPTVKSDGEEKKK